MSFVAENIGSGLLIYSIALYSLLYFALKKTGSIISIGDPLSLYLFFRLAPALVVLILSIFYIIDSHLNLIFLYFFNILISFVPILLLRYRQFKLTQLDLKNIYSFTIFLCTFKILLIFPTIPSLPIFTGGGSDAIIQYYENNKIAGILSLGIGNIDLVLLSFLRRSDLKGKKHTIVKTLMLIFVIFSLVTLKKGAILNMIFAIVFGEALALRYSMKPRGPILSTVNLVFALSIAVGWAYYIALESGVKFERLNLAFMFDLAIYQFMVPYVTYFKQEFWIFSTTYEFDKNLFYFHTLTSPLGAPAFDASIGPSYHEYLYGRITGNGINPTFLLEGIVFWGSFGILTTMLYTLMSLGITILLYIRFRLPVVIVVSIIVVTLVPVLWIDSLLFMKRLFSLSIVLTIYSLLFVSYEALKKVR